MSTIKLSDDKQKKIKDLSKIISIVAKVCSVACMIGAIALGIGILAISLVLASCKVSNNEIKIFGETISYVAEDNKITFQYKNQKDVVDKEEDVREIKFYLDKLENKNMLLIGVDISLICAIITLGLLHFALDNLDKLFRNINTQNTPFTIENAELIKKLAINLIKVFVASCVFEIFASQFLYNESVHYFDAVDVVTILFLFVLSYIFEYGTLIQKDSKGVMYDEK